MLSDGDQLAPSVMSWKAFSAQHTEHLGVPEGPPKMRDPRLGRPRLPQRE